MEAWTIRSTMEDNSCGIVPPWRVRITDVTRPWYAVARPNASPGDDGARALVRREDLFATESQARRAYIDAQMRALAAGIDELQRVMTEARKDWRR
jgi:hypothetical protein